MYQSVKPSKWQNTTPVTLWRRAIRRRIYTILSFTICLIIWSSLKSVNSESIRDKDNIPITPVLSRISPKSVRIRDFSHPDSSTEKHKRIVEDIRLNPEKEEVEQKSFPNINSEYQHQKPLDTVVTQHPSPASRQSPTETSSEAHQVLANGLTNQVSENVTPDEPDDGEETGLKGIAVSPKGKEQGSIAGTPSADISQQKLLTSSEGDTKDRKSRKLPKKQGNSNAYVKRTSFPTYSEYLALDLMADTLPDIIHVPFEESTSDVTLQGWEDQWFSDGVFDSDRWGKLQEPKIDFIYTCQ